MKIALFGLAGIKTGKHNLKDPRFDEADKLVEADKKTYAQVDVVGEDQLIDADAILVSVEGRADMILKDLEFVETRLGREPQEAERQALKKIQALLEQEKFVFNSGLTPEDLSAVAAHNFSPPNQLWWLNQRIWKIPTPCCCARFERPVTFAF